MAGRRRNSRWQGRAASVGRLESVNQATLSWADEGSPGFQGRELRPPTLYSPRLRHEAAKAADPSRHGNETARGVRRGMRRTRMQTPVLQC